MVVQKLKATFIHLLLSTALAGMLLGVVLFLWYPDLYLAFGASDGLIIFLCVDLVLGPLLTFVVYAPNKPSLYKDIATILTLQLAVFAFGVWTIYLQRPYLQVLTHQKIEIYAYDDIKTSGVNLPADVKWVHAGPHIYFMYLPEDLKQIDTIKFATEFVDQKPFIFRTDLYRPFSQGQQWGLATLLARFTYDSAHSCYWVDVSSKHFVGKACLDGHTGRIVLLE